MYHLLFVRTQAKRGPWGPGNCHPGLPWVSVDKFLPHTDHHTGVGTRCHLWPLSLTMLVPTPPLFSWSHPSSDTPVTASKSRLLKVALLDLTDPPFLVPWVTFATTLPQGLRCVCLSSSCFDKIFAPTNRCWTNKYAYTLLLWREGSAGERAGH